VSIARQVGDREVPTYVCCIGGSGAVLDWLKLECILNNPRAPRQTDRQRREQDVEALTAFIETQAPHVCAVGAEGMDARRMSDVLTRDVLESGCPALSCPALPRRAFRADLAVPTAGYCTPCFYSRLLLRAVRQ